MDGWYSVPAGHIDGGETARQCVARETLEEIGVTLRLDDIEVVHVMHRKAEDEIIYMDFFATAREYEGEIKNCEPDKCDELSWHALDSVPENTIPYIRQAIAALGVFGGVYMRDCTREFPRSWFTHARFQKQGEKPSAELNHFRVLASQPLSEWRRKGWVHPDDPRGWFQWYCRYYMGRRTPIEDARQIKRWKAIRRHIGQLKKHCDAGDYSCRPIQRQALLHWAYDSRKL
jgi:ADP-ribose pyrophosphatase YjhB (NUDIX family)